MGRPRLPVEEKIRRGTLRFHREIERLGGAAVAPVLTAHVVEPLLQARSYLLMMRMYVDGVLSGRIVACKWVQLACERQQRDLARAEEDPTWPYVWDDDEAIAACHFVEQCPHVEGKWTTPLILLEPCDIFLIGVLFGWRVRADRSRRRFTTLYLEVGRKSAKSTKMAAIGYYHLLREGELGASVICGATTGQQARMVFGIMQKMGRRSLWLRMQGVQVLSNSILTEDGEAKPVNSKATSLDGLNPSCIILDESHAQDFGLHDVLKSAQGARGNPLMLCPTTAGYDLLSVGYALHLQAQKVLEGIFVAEHLLGIIYTLDEGDDWRDERVWIKANPMLGITPTLDYLHKWCLDAQQVPGQEGEFRVKACSQWMQSATRWLSMTGWEHCADPTLKLSDFAGQRGWVAADLAQIDDLAAVAIVFEKDDLLIGFVKCFLPEGVVDGRARAVPEYRIWKEDDLLEATEGSMIDYARIEAYIRELCVTFQVQEIVFDQFGSAQICGNLANSGLPAILEAKNAKTFTPPARDLEARVTHGQFRHDGNSLFKWAASNAVVTRRTDDSILPKKESPESPNKIDPIDALLQANGARLRSKLQQRQDFQLLIIGGKKA